MTNEGISTEKVTEAHHIQNVDDDSTQGTLKNNISCSLGLHLNVIWTCDPLIYGELL